MELDKMTDEQLSLEAARLWYGCRWFNARHCSVLMSQEQIEKEGIRSEFLSDEPMNEPRYGEIVFATDLTAAMDLAVLVEDQTGAFDVELYKDADGHHAWVSFSDKEQAAMVCGPDSRQALARAITIAAIRIKER